MEEKVFDKIDVRDEYEQTGKRVLYRPHRGGLQEAMAESRVFDSIDEMEEFIAEQVKENPGCEDFTVDDIFYMGPMHDDDRIGWRDVRYIMIRTKPDNGALVWGMIGK